MSKRTPINISKPIVIFKLPLIPQLFVSQLCEYLTDEMRKRFFLTPLINNERTTN